MRTKPTALAVLLILLATACTAGEISPAEETAVDTTAPIAPSSSVPPQTTDLAPATSTVTTGDGGSTLAPSQTLPPVPSEFDGLPLPTARGEFFSASGACTVCHQEMEAAGQDVSIDSAWRSTMMANAARDPYWAAAVRHEVSSAPDLAAVIEDKCSTCHMPMARTTSVFDGGTGTVLGTGFAHPEHPLTDLATDGVSCSLCHQIQPAGLGGETSFSGGFTIDSTTPAGERSIFGPYDSPPGQAATMASISGFTPVRGDHIQSSDLCATCHTLYTPTLDAGGAVTGEFAEQTPYLEWLASSFATTASCQDCHLPEVEGSVRLSTTGGPPRSPFSQHHFVGGNTFMISVLRTLGESLGVTASSDQFDITLDRIERQLAERTATVEIADAAVGGNRLTATVTVTNLSGHKFPTGFPSRRAWLHVAVLDGSGTIVFESGRPEPTGAIAGNDNDDDAARFEPHYDLITDSAAVQIYEPVVGNTDGAVTTTLLSGAGYLKDNRLLPAGFDPAAASPDVLPAGGARTDGNFTGGSDMIVYDIDVSGIAGPLTIEVELLYQSVGYRWATNLVEADGPEIDRFRAALDAVANTPVRIAGAVAAAGG